MNHRINNSRTDPSSYGTGGPPSGSDRRGTRDLGWYVQRLEQIQSTTPHEENMPVVDSVIENGQPGITVTANAPVGDLFPYTEETYMGPASSTFQSTSPTSGLFFPMNEPERVLSTATNSFPRGRQIPTSYFPSAEIERNDGGITHTLRTPSFQSHPPTNNLSDLTTRQYVQRALSALTLASYRSAPMNRHGRAPPTATDSSRHRITFYFSPEETGRNDGINFTVHYPPFVSTPSTNEAEWINYFNVRGVTTRDGRSEIGLDEAVDTEVEPTDEGHRERVMSRIWDNLMEEFHMRSGTTSTVRETGRRG